jgi:hypothetical protein
VNTNTSYGDLDISGKDKETMSNEETSVGYEEVTVGYMGWMLVWACVALFGVLVVSAVLWN